MLRVRRRFQPGAAGEFRGDAYRAAKLEILRKLPEQLLAFEAALQKNGAIVHWAKDAAEARAIVGGILEKAGARTVVKSKSMVTEEIELNHALEARGIRAVETDL